jgi:CheY-like chemotaxis protein
MTDNFKIMIVVDEEYIRPTLSEELGEVGYQAITAASGFNLIRRIQDEQPDIIILDVKMVDYDGLELLTTIRDRFYDLPVIIYTAYDTFKEDMRSIRADPHLVKSYDLIDLKKKMALAIESRVRRLSEIASDESFRMIRNLTPSERWSVQEATLSHRHEQEVFGKDSGSGSITAQHKTNRKDLMIFLCHASEDKNQVCNLYDILIKQCFKPWLDERDLLPGQDWRFEIHKAINSCDVILVCLSRHAINKKGFVQKEIKDAFDVADTQPEGTIFIIPVMFEKCKVPDRLSRYQCVSISDEVGYKKLINALDLRASTKEQLRSEIRL